MGIFGRRGWRAAAATVAVAAAGTAWLHPHVGAEGRAPANAASAESPAVDLTALLTQVTVVDRIDDVPGYERSCAKGARCVFGPAWNDPANTTGCDTRNLVLKAQLQDVHFKPNTRDCKVIDGYLDPDPYTGLSVELHNVDIDHVVPLRRSWNAGAWKWDAKRRQMFANDPVELIAVSAHANRSKGDGGLDDWIPEYQPCAYVARYLTAAVKYQLPIAASERDVAIKTCG
ncbi:HNH endonuclease family protein [Mycolicibacterium sp. Y3]